MTSTFDLEALTLSNPVTGAKGAKTVPITYRGKQVVWQPDSQIVAFQPTAFQNETATRVNLVMRASQQAVESLTALDQHI